MHDRGAERRSYQHSRLACSTPSRARVSAACRALLLCGQAASPGLSCPGRQAATCPWMIKSGGRRLLLLVPLRMIQSWASDLFSPVFARVVLRPFLLALPRMIQSWALLGLVSASLHYLGLVRVFASLHHHWLLLLAAAPLLHGLVLMAAAHLHLGLRLLFTPLQHRMIQSGVRRLVLLDPPRMIQSVAFGRRLSPDDPVRGKPVLFVLSQMRPSGASVSHLSPDAPVRGAAAPAACSARDDTVRCVGTPSSAFWGRFVSAAPSCFAPYDPVLGTPCLRLLLAACPRPRPGLFLTAPPRAPPLCCSCTCEWETYPANHACFGGRNILGTLSSPISRRPHSVCL